MLGRRTGCLIIMNATIIDAVSRTNFGVLDWIIVAIYLVGSLAMGWIGRKYIRDMTDYIGAGRAIGTRLGIATMTGTEMGLVTVMYSAQKGFTGGFAAFHIALFAGAVTLFVGLSGFIICRLRTLEVLTIPEFYEKRFGRRTRILGGAMLALGGILNMGLFLKVGSMFIVGITGLSSEGWAVPAVMSILLILVLIYTVLGGMVSVVVTDYIQFVVLSLGLLLATFLVIFHVGWNPMFETVLQEKGAAGFDPLVAGGGFGLDYVLWMVFLGLVNCAIWPTAIARALAMENLTSLKRQYRWSALSFVIRNMVPYFWGIGAFVFIFTQAPDLKEAFFPSDASKPALDNLYAMPVFLGRILPVGAIGIITAAMIAAFMSTHDSYLLCWSSVITQDIIAPLRGNRLSTTARITLTRVLIVLIGLYILYWGLIYSGKQDVWDYMAVTGAVYFSGAFALLVGGLYWKRASATGAVLALLCGFMAILGLNPVRDHLIGFLNHQADFCDQRGLAAAGGAVRFLSSKLGLVSGAMVGLGTIIMTVIAMGAGSLLFPDRNRSFRGEAGKTASDPSL
jgi:solute:Na+ symporter, SSS family